MYMAAALMLRVENCVTTVLTDSGAMGLCDEDSFEHRSVLSLHGSHLACH